MLHSDITDAIIKAYYLVYNELGYGFLEKVYERALLFELRSKGLMCESQIPIKVYYKGFEMGDYYADLIVENTVIIELKAAEVLVMEHEAQLTNYLRATDKEVGLLLNFGKKPEFKRKIFENRFKTNFQI
jgi:GxxExxY protein